MISCNNMHQQNNSDIKFNMLHEVPPLERTLSSHHYKDEYLDIKDTVLVGYHNSKTNKDVYRITLYFNNINNLYVRYNVQKNEMKLEKHDTFSFKIPNMKQNGFVKKPLIDNIKYFIEKRWDKNSIQFVF